MSTTPKHQASPSQLMVHRKMQEQFNRHRHKFDRHRARGGAFAARLDELERRLFGSTADEAAPAVLGESE